MKKSSFVHYITKILVDVMFYGGIIACLSIPFWSKFLTGYIYFARETFSGFLILLSTSGITAVYIMWQLKRIFKSLLTGNPFISQNVSAFRKIAVSSCLIAVIYAIKCVFYFTIATALIVAVFVIATLLCLTLKDVFKQAVYYKEENDWTV